MKNLLVVLVTVLGFSHISSAAMNFICTDASNNVVRLNVAAPNQVSLDTNFAHGNLALQGAAAAPGYAKFGGFMAGKESHMEFSSVILVSPALLTAHVVPHGFSLGSIVIQSNSTGQGQVFSCR